MATLAVCKIMEEAEHSPPNFPHSSEIYMVVVQHKVGFEKKFIQSNGYVITRYLLKVVYFIIREKTYFTQYLCPSSKHQKYSFV